MKIAISSARTKDAAINREELVRDLQSLGHTIVFIGRDSNNLIHSDFEKNNIQFLPIPMSRNNLNPIHELKSIVKAIKVIREANIDILIAYGIRTFPTIVISAKLVNVKKILCIVNGSGRLFQLTGIKGRMAKLISYPMLWLSFLAADRILFQNPDDLKLIKEKKLLPKKNYGTINGSGVNLDKFHSNILQPNPVFTMISRLTGLKGVNEYIQAARYVKNIHPEAVFNLIGPIDDNDSSIDMIELNKAIDEEIVFLKGKVEDVRPYIDKCRVFVLPSYYPEGIPRSIIEAMAMSRPIITTDSSGCRETVINGVNGFLVTPRNSKDLSEKMIWMIEHEKEVEKMGMESRYLCENRFDVNKINENILNELNLK